MNPAANHCPLPKSAVWRFLSLYFHRNTALPNHRNTSSNPPFPRNPHFPALRSGHRLLQRPSPQKQFLSNNGGLTEIYVASRFFGFRWFTDKPGDVEVRFERTDDKAKLVSLDLWEMDSCWVK